MNVTAMSRGDPFGTSCGVNVPSRSRRHRQFDTDFHSPTDFSINQQPKLTIPTAQSGTRQVPLHLSPLS